MLSLTRALDYGFNCHTGSRSAVAQVRTADAQIEGRPLNELRSPMLKSVNAPRR